MILSFHPSDQGNGERQSARRTQAGHQDAQRPSDGFAILPCFAWDEKHLVCELVKTMLYRSLTFRSHICPQQEEVHYGGRKSIECTSIPQGKRDFCWFASVVNFLYNNTHQLKLGDVVGRFVDQAKKHFQSSTYDNACPRIPKQVGFKMDTRITDRNFTLLFLEKLLVVAGYTVIHTTLSEFDAHASIANKEVTLTTFDRRNDSFDEDRRYFILNILNPGQWPLPAETKESRVIGAFLIYSKPSLDGGRHAISITWCNGKWHLCNSNVDQCSPNIRGFDGTEVLISCSFVVIRNPDKESIEEEIRREREKFRRKLEQFSKPSANAVSLVEWKKSADLIQIDDLKISWPDVQRNGERRLFKIFEDETLIGESNQPFLVLTKPLTGAEIAIEVRFGDPGGKAHTIEKDIGSTK